MTGLSVLGAGASLGIRHALEVDHLAAFCALSIVTMAAVAAPWGRALGTATSRHLEAAAGVLGVGVGGSISVESIAALGGR